MKQMKKLFILPLMLVAFSVSACQTLQGTGQKQQVGTVGGAVLGGILGSQVGDGSGRLVATGAGVLLGAFLGGEIGKSLDNADRAMMAQANQRATAAPLGQTISWNNPDSGNYGSVTPVRDGQSSYGAYCREYEQTIVVDGRAETAVGTACQRDDGTWEIVS